MTDKDYQETLKHRLKSLVYLFNKNEKYPFSVRILGFSVLIVKNKEELLSRIKELSEVLKVKHLIKREIGYSDKYAKVYDL